VLPRDVSPVTARGQRNNQTGIGAILAVFRLDYLSCVLTILSTVLVGRKQWTGFVVAGVNSIIICGIGLKPRN
jgi:hypothetical protein